jgi:hypothetical protein
MCDSKNLQFYVIRGNKNQSELNIIQTIRVPDLGIDQQTRPESIESLIG